MDGSALDRLSRAVGAAASRRGLFGLLTGLPVAGFLASGGDVAAKSGRQRHRRHARTKGRQGTQERRDAHSAACIPTGQRCPSKKPRGKKGKKLGCNKCCQGSFITEASGKTFCGCRANGQACTTDTASSCCSGACVEGVCSAAADACSTCSGTTPICQGNVCVACSSANQCPASAICMPDGSCRPCDVCHPAGACTFATIQTAIDATPPLSTIYVCPGTYADPGAFGSVIGIRRSLRLIGAGDDADPATNTILTPNGPDQPVMLILADTEDIEVALEGLRLTGATGSGGYGLGVTPAPSVGKVTASLTGCTITNNVNTVTHGGLLVGPQSRVTLVETQVTANTGTDPGGIDVHDGHLTLDALSRVTGNTATVGNGGIRCNGTGVVDLPSVDNVTGNFSAGTNKNCGGTGTFNGLGAICTTT